MIYTQNVPAGRYGDVYSNLAEIVAMNQIYKERDSDRNDILETGAVK
jgi:hypothetical protein